MAKSNKPYPGLGKYVVLLDYDGTWVAYAGANSMERARARKREMNHWPSNKVKIVENV